MGEGRRCGRGTGFWCRTCRLLHDASLANRKTKIWAKPYNFGGKQLIYQSETMIFFKISFELKLNRIGLKFILYN